MARKNFIFTNRKHTRKGIFATILGIISIGAVFFSIYLTYGLEQGAPINYGLSVLLAFVFSIIGFFLAVIARIEKDQFYLFAYIGMAVNTIALAMIVFMLYAGMRGI